ELSLMGDEILPAETAPPLLEFRNICKSFSGNQVLHEISYSMESGRIIALVGENGAGKSTLMKILCGVLPDYEGGVLLQGKPEHFGNPREAEQAGIAMIHQELNLIPDLSAGENIFLGKEPVGKAGQVNFKKMHRKAEEILTEFEFPFSSRIKIRNLPVGWQQMVEIARALQLDAKIIVMDEPTSALSEHEIELLFGKMRLLKQSGRTLIFISHRLKEIFDIADEIAVLRDGRFMGKFPAQQVTRDQLIRRMIGREYAEQANRNKPGAAEPVLQVQNLQVRQQDKTVLENIHFNLHKGEVLGIAGLLGAGRSELLRFIYGALSGRYSGQITYFNKLYNPLSAAAAIKKGIVYLPEDRKTDGIFPTADLQFNSSISFLPEISSAGFVNNHRERAAVDKQFNALQVRHRSKNQKIPTLSGGNQQKVLLSRVLLLNPKLLLLDEPTRGIDIGAKMDIYKLIQKLSRQGAAILVTSSEIPELLQMCRRVLVLSGGRQTALLDSDKTDPQQILKFAFKRI
ncbi:MAG: sugar ABC transporter ATP-binding protein, partial [Calditrichia bacterium]